MRAQVARNASHSAPAPGRQASSAARERSVVGRQVEARPVREAVARHGLDRQQLELVGEGGARLGEQRLEHPGHGQQRRAGVPREPVARDAPDLAARRRAGLQHAHAMPERRQPDPGREAADARAHDDDAAHARPRRSRRHSAGTATAPIAAAPAAATRGRRHSTAFANVSPSQVQT